jgi:hypothetical protein
MTSNYIPFIHTIQKPQQRLNEIVLKIVDLLPHGAGIDCDWQWEVGPWQDLEFYNSYHRMNDSGMYCDWIDFKVQLKAERHTRLRQLKGPCLDKVQICESVNDLNIVVSGFGRHQDIGDWVYEGVHYSLTALRKELQSPWTGTVLDIEVVRDIEDFYEHGPRYVLAEMVWDSIGARDEGLELPLTTLDVVRLCSLAQACRKLVREEK